MVSFWKDKIKKTDFNKTLLMVLLTIPIFTFAQENKQQKKELKASKKYVREAQQALEEEKFISAEADYRKAIALDPKNETATYNLGTAYYGREKNAEAMLRFKQAAATATTKTEKHKAFHNLGNTFMNEKKYGEAVEAYKHALRNNPKDDETRYNLALAKDLLEKNPPPPQESDDQDQNQNQDQDEKDQDQDQQSEDNQDKEGDKGEDKDEADKGDEKEDKDNQDKDEGNPDEPKEGEGDKPQEQQPVPGQLSPEQVKSLLEAMNNEEKKVQDKINAEKQRGSKVKSDKDW